MAPHSLPLSDPVAPVPKELYRSRWATSQPASLPRVRTLAERLAQEKYKAERLLRRLYWKGESLRSSYKRALDILRCDVPVNGPLVAAEYSFLLGPGTDEASWLQAKKMSENMFKVDFFEFYAVLEKFITLCLAFYGTYVSPTSSGQNINALRQASLGNPVSSSVSTSATHAMQHVNTNGRSWHSFHANLLDEVGKESCPLHDTLGKQDMYIQLRLAKNYRNQWKNADDEDAERNGYGRRRHVIMLEDLNLDVMIRTLLTGCLEAYQKLQGEQSSGPNPTVRLTGEMEIDMDDDDVPYEAVGDAMEIDDDL